MKRDNCPVYLGLTAQVLMIRSEIIMSTITKKQLQHLINNGHDVTGLDLSGANLRNADLRNANLSDADLRYADLDFSCFPLWCGSLRAKFDDRVLIQLLAHVKAASVDNDNVISPKLKKLLKMKSFMNVVDDVHREEIKLIWEKEK